MKVFSVTGFSKSGKTTTATKLIANLKKKGFSVAAIKDVHFEQFTMEKEGTDSWKMQQSGANPIIARGLKETFFVHPYKMDLASILEYLNTEWVIVEGMKTAPLPKIVCAETEDELGKLVDDSTFAISGKISDRMAKFGNLPVISSLNSINELAELVESIVFPVLPLNKEECCKLCGLSCEQMVAEILKGRRKRTDCMINTGGKIRLKISGKEIAMVPFVENILKDVITAFAKNLRGYKNGTIEIDIP